MCRKPRSTTNLLTLLNFRIPHAMSLSNNNIQFQKLSDKATIPTRANQGDAGYDIFASVNAVVPPRSNKLISTDICVRFPDPPMPGTSVYGRIAPRSGLALRSSIDTMGGVVDFSYTGNIGVILVNHSDTPFQVNQGDRVAQLIVTLCLVPEVQEVDNISSEVTERGTGGFGSSGV